MEFINRIELQGVVGRAEVNSYNDKRVCNFSVVTEYSARDRSGNPLIDTLWFNVSYWEGRDPEVTRETLDKIAPGSWVYVTGRLKLRKYTTVENEERTVLEVMARSLKLVDKDDTFMQPQRG